LKTIKLSKTKLKEVWDPGSEIRKKPIPDPGSWVKKALDPWLIVFTVEMSSESKSGSKPPPSLPSYTQRRKEDMIRAVRQQKV
jgi:hypothetical protein